jgi:hypothetical protein
MLKGYEDHESNLVRMYQRSDRIIRISRLKGMDYFFYAEINYLSDIETSPRLKTVAGCEAWVDSQIG